ncbi:type VI secretion system-associated protein TagF [Methylomonas sp. LW13]|uniref:type VI secretion system-associated protein TagF n=1 Tax=unclassified Methylomonas TaxID=2608980 RepID=UPI000A02A9BB|nr:type VI secretion system-associated protein TagF [Methylomonas sp. LW13]QBC29464.1 type VI secretion system-associated protein TagF [Methylomonas sp. LW13]
MSSMDGLSVGFFGKVPGLGDFVSRRLPRHFIEPWDQWLQASMRSSQETLGESWLSLFLVSPLWRFALRPGVCGGSAWAGVMMPSVDRVGRYYPLTLAQAVSAESLLSLFSPESAWFAQLEDAALSVLNDSCDLDQFDKGLMEIGSADSLTPQYFQADSSGGFGVSNGKLAFRFDLEGQDQTDVVFPHLSQRLLDRFMPGYSIWASEGGQSNRPNLLICEGLPPIDAYASFLQGMPQAGRSWHVQSYRQDQSVKKIEREPSASAVGATASQDITLPNSTKWASYGVTVVGNKRKHNEDALLDCPSLGLWVVADGMGGHQSGDVASRLVVDSLSTLEFTENLDNQVEAVSRKLHKINDDLCRFASGIQQGSIVGTTVVALLAKGDQCAAIWAGDSRLYQLRQGEFTQITRDHTLIDELMDSGVMTREVAAQQVGANVITRAVGGQLTLALDVLRFQAAGGDRYLLCSDGLDKELSEAEIAELMGSGSCQSAAEALINQALSRSGRDNITVLIAEFSG